MILTEVADMPTTTIRIQVPKTPLTRFVQYSLSRSHVIEFALGDTTVDIVVADQMGLDAVGKLFRDMWRELEPLITPED